MTLSEVRQLLRQLDLHPSRARGQNFLVDANILALILSAADVRSDETVLEIGPGLGVLTRELLVRAKRVIAIEIDRRLCRHLRHDLPSLELVEADAVEFLANPANLPADGYKVIANLPYSVSTPVLERLVESERKPRQMVLLLQREVAQRLAAPPRHRDYGALTLFTQLYFHVTIAHVVSPRCFHPEPGVDSAITILDRREPRVQLQTGAPFHQIVRLGFSQRRKMLRNLLTSFADADRALQKVGINSTARGEELSLEQWISLANELR